MNSVDPIRVCFPSRRPQMDETKNATQGARTQRGGGPDKARAKQRDGVGDARVQARPESEPGAIKGDKRLIWRAELKSTVKLSERSEVSQCLLVVKSQWKWKLLGVQVAKEVGGLTVVQVR
ncbi:hypothetical protein GBA52_015285 [Prunus armeniaca]|nr:hypothetical protein GBA52_015285 [Prunus armeniaca]